MMAIWIAGIRKARLIELMRLEMNSEAVGCP
jgi:hypothetical protein